MAALQRKWSKWSGSGSGDHISSSGSSSSGDMTLAGGVVGSGEGVATDSSDSSPAEESLARMFAVGGLAGVIETYALQPLIYWKTMSQVESTNRRGTPIPFLSDL